MLRTQLWSGTKAGDVIVLDRAYAEYVLLAYAQKQQREIVVRLPRGRFSVCEEFWQSKVPEQIIELPLPATPATRALVEQLGLPQQLTVRLIRVVLPSGETEVLMTTLLDQVAYPAAEFKQVYGWRWGEETFFDRFKNIFEVERFSGTSLTAIEQDVRGAFFLASLESVLNKPDQQVLGQQAAERETRYVPQVNHAVCYLALVERVTQLLLSKESTERVHRPFDPRHQ